MGLHDLPPELFQRIVELLVKMPGTTRGVVEAWKARRVCSKNNAAGDSPP
jgi:hypothetical protein